MQSHYIKVTQEQKMNFGLIFGQLAILKKRLRADYEQLLRVFFSCLQGQKNNLNFLKKYFSICTKKLHKMKVKKPKKNL
jgi:hypothetical protein